MDNMEIQIVTREKYSISKLQRAFPRVRKNFKWTAKKIDEIVNPAYVWNDPEDRDPVDCRKLREIAGSYRE
jgi:hypothetical protein